MIETFLRPLYQRTLVDPLARNLNLAPNTVTLLGAGLGLGAAMLIPFTPFAILFLLLSGYCDTLDGTLARKKSQSSPFGSALDIVCDRLVEGAVVIGLYFAGPDRAFLALLMLGSILLCVTSFLVVAIFSENNTQKSFYSHPGLIERGEAFAFFCAMILLPAYFFPLATLFIAGVLLTTALRLRAFRRHLKIVS